MSSTEPPHSSDVLTLSILTNESFVSYFSTKYLNNLQCNPVPELIVGEAGWRSNISSKLRPRFAHQWPDNLKKYKYM